MQNTISKAPKKKKKEIWGFILCLPWMCLFVMDIGTSCNVVHIHRGTPLDNWLLLSQQVSFAKSFMGKRVTVLEFSLI